MYFLENSTSNFNFHTEEMPENNKRNTKMVTGEEIGSGGGEFTLQSKPQESSQYFIHPRGPANSTAFLTSQRHPGKFPIVPCRSRGKWRLFLRCEMIRILDDFVDGFLRMS